MQGGVQYIWYVLLFALTGVLCGQQLLSQPDKYLCYTDGLTLRQMPMPIGNVGRYDLSMTVPEITGSICSVRFDLKTTILHLFTTTHGTAETSSVSQALFRQPADLHLHPIAYYVFSLGKIVT